MSANKLQYKKMTTEELVVLSQQNNFKALEELIRREQKNVLHSPIWRKNVKILQILLKRHFCVLQKISGT